MPKRSPLPDACMLARALEVVGEWWTLLIIRDAFFGVRHFEAFQHSLGIARNVLATRLGKLVEVGILVRRPDPEDGRRIEYRLTEKGKALLPTIIAFAQWGDKWHRDADSCIPYFFVDRETGQPIREVVVQSADGRTLTCRDIRVVAGPGMTDAIRARMPAFRPRDAEAMAA
jgi:DNA-binding HxlR family transcriptional regulator